MKILVKYLTSTQITEDSYKKVWIEKLFEPSDTIEDILVWYRGKNARTLEPIEGLYLSIPEQKE
jgi:hypothetical protein